MSLCESNCELIGYKFDKKEVICECNIKIKLPLISEIVVNKNKLLNNFINLKETTNIYTMKCLKLLFSKNGLMNNIGNYILLTILILNISLSIYFKLKEFDNFCNKIEELIQNIEENNEINYITKTPKVNIKNSKYNLQNKKENRYKGKNQIKKMKLRDSKKEDKEKKYFNVSIKEKNIKNKVEIRKGIISNEPLSNFSNSSLTIYKKDKIIKSKISKEVSKILKYNDYELNNLEYEKALEIDKRKYLEYYVSLIKRRQIILFKFYTNDDYNSKIIKISLFLFSFSIYFTINALFFDDSTMHNIYEAKGSYNFIYQIPIILYSTIISAIINYVIKFLSLSEKNIINLKGKKEEEKENIDEVFLKTKKILIIKFTFFYIFNFLFLIFFWLYISSFCAVYQNTQIYLIKDTIISFALSLIYAFFICLIPGILRIPSLNAYKKDKKCIYVFSKLLQLI